MPDFLQAGNDGTLPDGFTVWRRGVTYTVRPEILTPLHRGQEYQINATVRRKIANGEEFTAYGDLYQRCTGILRARSAKLTSCDEGEPLHTWVTFTAIVTKQDAALAENDTEAEGQTGTDTFQSTVSIPVACRITFDSLAVLATPLNATIQIGQLNNGENVVFTP
jgi:hypothetical protein